MPNEISKPDQTLGALILAAGFSSRIQGFKPLLEIGGKTLLEHAISLFATEGISQVITVIGYRGEDLIKVLKANSTRYVVNKNYQDGMFSSVQRGVEVLQDACDAFFLLPADISFVRPETIHKLRDAYLRDSSPLLFYPQFQTKRGHPPLISTRLASSILSYSGEGGLRGILADFQNQARNVSVNDPFILLDVDTQEDFLRLQSELESHKPVLRLKDS